MFDFEIIPTNCPAAHVPVTAHLPPPLPPPRLLPLAIKSPHPAAGNSQGSTHSWGHLPIKSPMQDRDFEQLANAGLSVFDLNSEYLAQKDW